MNIYTFNTKQTKLSLIDKKLKNAKTLEQLKHKIS